MPRVASIYVTFHISIEEFLPLTPPILRCHTSNFWNFEIDDREVEAGIDGWIEGQIDRGGRAGELSNFHLSLSLSFSLLFLSLSLSLSASNASVLPFGESEQVSENGSLSHYTHCPHTNKNTRTHTHDIWQIFDGWRV